MSQCKAGGIISVSVQFSETAMGGDDGSVCIVLAMEASSVPMGKPDMMAHACNPSAREAETRVPEARCSARLLTAVQVQEESSQKLTWRVSKEETQHTKGNSVGLPTWLVS